MNGIWTEGRREGGERGREGWGRKCKFHIYFPKHQEH